MTCGPCARSQASVICPAEASCFVPTCLISSTTLSTLGKFSFEYRGMLRLRSPSSKSSGLVYAWVGHKEEELMLDVGTYIFASQQAPPEGRIRKDGYTELTRGLYSPDLRVFGVQCEG